MSDPVARLNAARTKEEVTDGPQSLSSILGFGSSGVR
jgi:hypothetical protein